MSRSVSGRNRVSTRYATIRSGQSESSTIAVVITAAE